MANIKKKMNLLISYWMAQKIKGFAEQSGLRNDRNRMVLGILVIGAHEKSRKAVLLKLTI